MSRLLGVLGLITLLLGAFTPPAGAHGVSDTADFHLAQSFAGNELTLVVRRTQDVPGPLTIDFIAHDPVRPVGIDVALLGTTQQARLSVDRIGTHTVRLAVDRSGPWELALTTESGQRARIPFRVMVSRLSAWEPVAYGGFAATGLFVGAALIAAFVARRRVAIVLPAAAGVIALTVGLTAALLSSSIPPAQAEGAIPVGPGRPYVNHVMSPDSDPVTGKEFALRLSLTDGNTGHPADDLVAHHDALAHLVVSSVDGRFFRHLHPVRTAPGELAVRLTVDRPGKYLAHAEFERVNSGSQLVTGSFEATGADLGGAYEPPADVRQAQAGRSLTIDMAVGGKANLQSWLGMAGHLVVRDQASGFFGHVHEMGSMTTGRPVADETVATHRPHLRFTFTFPQPGRYFGWVQYQRNFAVPTVPIVIEVR